MREIYSLFVSLSIAGLPDDLNAETEDSCCGDHLLTWTPYSIYSLTYTHNGETRTIVSSDDGPWCLSAGLPETRERLVAFAAFVYEYISGTEAYLDMPQIEWGYL